MDNLQGPEKKGFRAFLQKIAPEVVPGEKPQNGLAGLRHWFYDMRSGFVVSMISVSFSLGIARQSGFPPMAGLMADIVAGIIMPILGGSFMTVAGPAAGLAPVLLASMIKLAGGDEANQMDGYPLITACIVFVGVIQLLLAAVKGARIVTSFFSHAIIGGMLMAVGVIIMVKQTGDILGFKLVHEESLLGDFWPLFGQIYEKLPHANPNVLIVSLPCVAIVVSMVLAEYIMNRGKKDEDKRRWAGVVAPLVVAPVAIALSYLLSLDAVYRIQLPNILSNPAAVFQKPDFSGLLKVWPEALKIVLFLVAIDTTEALGTAKAVDKIDPYGRNSEANRLLVAIGLSNLISGGAGGTTIIHGGLKSGAVVASQGRTLWTNVYVVGFLMLYITVGLNLVNYLPFGGIGAIVALMGLKLCGPEKWIKAYKAGPDQFTLTLFTCLACLTTDLFIGVLMGTVLKTLMVWYRSSRTEGGRKLGIFGTLLCMFKSPVNGEDAGITYKEDGDYLLQLDGFVWVGNFWRLQRALQRIPHDVKLVVVQPTSNALFIDLTSQEALEDFAKGFNERGRGVVQLNLEEGMVRLNPDHPHSSLVPSISPTASVKVTENDNHKSSNKAAELNRPPQNTSP